MRDRKFHDGIAALLVAGLLACWPAGLSASDRISIERGAKQGPYQSQVGMTFTNAEKQAAYGLDLEFSVEAEVVFDEKTNNVGPFTTVEGNGSKQIKLMRSNQPIKSGDPGIALVFRSYKSKLKINKWWWLDEKDKRIGHPQKVH